MWKMQKLTWLLLKIRKWKSSHFHLLIHVNLVYNNTLSNSPSFPIKKTSHRMENVYKQYVNHLLPITHACNKSWGMGDERGQAISVPKSVNILFTSHTHQSSTSYHSFWKNLERNPVFRIYWELLSTSISP